MPRQSDHEHELHVERPTDFAVSDRPPMLIPFFAFRIMVGCGMIMLVHVSQLPFALGRNFDGLVYR